MSYLSHRIRDDDRRELDSNGGDASRDYRAGERVIYARAAGRDLPGDSKGRFTEYLSARPSCTFVRSVAASRVIYRSPYRR